MRPSTSRFFLLLSCLPLLVAGCATVQVSRQGPDVVEVAPLLPPVRGDRARTADFPLAESDGYRPPARLAVILPTSGAAAPAAASVRDGLLAAYYAETRPRPLVKFYDSLGTGAGAQAAVSRALAEGAQMIVGPLTREEVAAVSADPGVPMILLNRSDSRPPPGSTSFALLPGAEGTAAAERLLARGLGSVLVFTNRSDSAQRAVAAFAETLRAKGGEVVSEIAVVGETPDMSAQLGALLAGPRPPTAIFMALEGDQARAVAAQLRVSALVGLPRIATSQIISGHSGSELDGIEYPALPWLLGQAGGLPDAESLAKSLPSGRGPAQRLFAFGADAWKLAAYFERLYDDPSHTIRGATGTLSIDITGPVRWTPTWAVFSGGRGRAAYPANAAAASP